MYRRYGTFHFMVKNETEIALGIVINDKKALLIERKQREIGRNGKPIVLAFPGGKLEPGESPADAAVREVKEETGYLVEATEAIVARSHPEYPVYVHYIGCRLLGQMALDQLPETIVNTQWAPLDSLDQLFTWPMNDQVRAYVQNHLSQ